jgi:hypothetical protein
LKKASVPLTSSFLCYFGDVVVEMSKLGEAAKRSAENLTPLELWSLQTKKAEGPENPLPTTNYNQPHHAQGDPENPYPRCDYLRGRERVEPPSKNRSRYQLHPVPLQPAPAKTTTT